MKRLVNSHGMRHSFGHRETGVSRRAHVGQRPPNIMPIAKQALETDYAKWAVEKVVNPMRCISQKGLGLNLTPPIFGYDSQHECMKLHIMVGMYCAGGCAQF